MIALLVSTMMASFAMLFVASTNPPELVVESYANIDELTEKTRLQDQAAAELELTAGVRIDGTVISVELSGNEQAVLPASLVVYARNSTRAELDSKAELQGMNGLYQGVIALPDNAYDLRITDPEGNWRLSKRLIGQPSFTEITPFVPGQ